MLHQVSYTKFDEATASFDEATASFDEATASFGEATASFGEATASFGEATASTGEGRTAAPSGVAPGPARRTLDVLAAAVGLLLLSPVLVLLALAVKLSSPGPVLFRQTRIGQGFSLFTIFKFRTMRAGSAGPEFTPAGDARITRVGQLLRHSGLDELPQLLNVLRGEMTLVGPRPETPSLARRYPDDCHQVFAYRPGLTGPAQVRLRDKEVLSAEGSDLDLEQYYLGELVRKRAALDLAYLAHPTLGRTLAVVAETVAYIASPLTERLAGLLRLDRREPADRSSARA